MCETHKVKASWYLAILQADALRWQGVPAKEIKDRLVRAARADIQHTFAGEV